MPGISDLEGFGAGFLGGFAGTRAKRNLAQAGQGALGASRALRDALAVKQFQMDAEAFRSKSAAAAQEEKRRLQKEAAQLEADQLRLNRMAQNPEFMREVEKYTGEQGPSSYESLSNILSKLPNEERDELMDVIQFSQFSEYIPKAQQVTRERIQHLVGSGAFNNELGELEPTLQPVIESLMEATDPNQTPIFSSLDQIKEFAAMMDSTAETVNAIAKEQTRRRTDIQDRVMAIDRFTQSYAAYTQEYDHPEVARQMWLIIQGLQGGSLSPARASELWAQIGRRDMRQQGGGLDAISALLSGQDPNAAPQQKQESFDLPVGQPSSPPPDLSGMTDEQIQAEIMALSGGQ